MVCIPEKARAPETADRRFAVRPRTHDQGFQVQVPGYRYYNPSLARWVNRDPILERGAGVLLTLRSAGMRPSGEVRWPYHFLGNTPSTGHSHQAKALRCP